MVDTVNENDIRWILSIFIKFSLYNIFEIKFTDATIWNFVKSRDIYLLFHLLNRIGFIVVKGNIRMVLIEPWQIDSYLSIETIRAIYRYLQEFALLTCSKF